MEVRRGALVICLSCLVACVVSAIPAGANWGSDPATREWPAWPYQTTCGYTLFDPVAIFSQPATAELGKAPAQRALRRFLKHPVINWVPRHNYRVLRESRREAEFLSSPLSSELGRSPELLRFERRKGHWRWSGSGGCVPASVVHNRPAIGWDLAYDRPPPEPTATAIKVQLGPGECAGGQSQNDRAHPVFTEIEGKLLLTIWLSPPKGHGVQTCVGTIEPPLKVKLPEPLGDREIYDGGTYPPHPARGASREFF